MFIPVFIPSGYNHHMVTLYLNGNPPWLKVFGDDQKPRVVLVTVLTSLILLLYDGLMVSHTIFTFRTCSFWIVISYFISFQSQATFGAYVYSYAVKGAVHIKPSHAAYLNSLFWVSMSRNLLSIIVTQYLWSLKQQALIVFFFKTVQSLSKLSRNCGSSFFLISLQSMHPRGCSSLGASVLSGNNSSLWNDSFFFL